MNALMTVGNFWLGCGTRRMPDKAPAVIVCFVFYHTCRTSPKENRAYASDSGKGCTAVVYDTMPRDGLERQHTTAEHTPDDSR